MGPVWPPHPEHTYSPLHPWDASLRAAEDRHLIDDRDGLPAGINDVIDEVAVGRKAHAVVLHRVRRDDLDVAVRRDLPEPQAPFAFPGADVDNVAAVGRDGRETDPTDICEARQLDVLERLRRRRR